MGQGESMCTAPPTVDVAAEDADAADAHLGVRREVAVV
jgi:hypothetical protein